MSLRDWTWRYGFLFCQSEDLKSSCDLYNGTWRSPDGKQSYCWKHYQAALRDEAAQDDSKVLAERQRIADSLLAWYQMWQKPARVAFTDKTVASSETITTWWIKEFSDKIRDGTFGKPTIQNRTLCMRSMEDLVFNLEPHFHFAFKNLRTGIPMMLIILLGIIIIFSFLSLRTVPIQELKDLLGIIFAPVAVLAAISTAWTLKA